MTLITFIYFVLGLGLLIFIHELGHFLVAKFCGIRVEKFSLGFGPALIAFSKDEGYYRLNLLGLWNLKIRGPRVVRGETEYRISVLPLGGYVKMAGEEPEEEVIQPVHDPRSFSAQSLGKRISVVMAGPLMNLALAFVLMPIVFWMGKSEPAFMEKAPVVIGVKKGSPAEKFGFQKGDEILSVDGKATPTWEAALQRILVNPDREVALQIKHPSSGKEETKNVLLSHVKEGKAGFLGVEPPIFIGNDAVVEKIQANSPAEKAGIQPHDKILAINGEAVESWEDMSEKVGASQGKPVQLEVLRGTEKVTLSLTPQYSDDNKKWIIGITKEISADYFVKRRYALGDAVRKGAQENIKLFALTFEVLKKLVTGQLSYKALGGPVQIATATAQAAQSGMSDFIYFLAYLSIQLGILNLLPIPVLDGGHLFFMLYEAIRRKPLSVRKRLIAQQVGMLLLLTLMVLVTLNDIDTTWGFRRIFSKIVGWF